MLLPGLLQEPSAMINDPLAEQDLQCAFRKRSLFESQCGVKQRRGDVSGAACPAGGSPTYPAEPPS